MDAELARKMWRTLEPYHGLVYFSPKATEAYAELGLVGQDAYFASRAAPMGAVSAPVVVATFFNFRPQLVERAIPAAWAKASPATICDARLAAVDAQLTELLGDQIKSAEMVEAADLARTAADACTAPGRPLYAGHASLPWPDEPHLALWHAVSLLREYRGDGHIAALVAEGIGGCEALVTHGGDGQVPNQILQSTRGWTDDEWHAANARLEARGLFADGQPTALGVESRERVERITDEQAMPPWRALGQDGSDRLRALVRPWSRAVVESGVFLTRPFRTEPTADA